MAAMHFLHGLEISLSDEMKRFEKLNFIKKNSSKFNSDKLVFSSKLKK